MSKHVSNWAKRVQVLRTQAAVINSLHVLKNFDAILKMDKGKQRDKISHTSENACERKIHILWSGPETETMPSIWEEV